MTTADLLVLLGLGVLVAAVADEVARRTARSLPWAAAGGFLLIAAAPLVPNRSVALGLSLDDVLPLMGLLVLIPMVPWTRVRAMRWEPQPGVMLALAGLGLMIAAGLVSAILVGDGIGDALRLALRGSGRLVLLLAVVVCVAVLGAAAGARLWSARMIALVGAFEAAFGLAAYFIGLPGGAGLERARPNTVLDGAIPGRISGTIGISPNFTAAILMMSLLVTAGLGLQATSRRERVLWWALATLQLGAIALTYTRVSLGLVLVALVVLIVIRGRAILLIPISAVVGAVALLTPTVQRFLTDAPDRLALWASAWLLMIDHPFGGVGPGQMLSAVAQDPDRYRFTPFGSAWSTAHNTVFLAGAETGVPGLIGAIVLNVGLALIAIEVMRRAPRGPSGSVRFAAGLAVLAFLAQGMVNNLFTVGVTSVCAAFLLGALLVDARPRTGMVDAADPAVARGWPDLLADWRRAAVLTGARVRRDLDASLRRG